MMRNIIKIWGNNMSGAPPAMGFEGAPPAMGFDQARVKNTRAKMRETIKYQIRDYPYSMAGGSPDIHLINFIDFDR